MAGGMAEKQGRILVIGGGIAGITSALEAAEAGYQVTLVEKQPTLGGRVAGFYQYFPKLCPPTCGLEINYRRMRPNGRIRLHTSTVVEAVTGTAGNFRVRARGLPAYVNERCVTCGKCTPVCPASIPNELDYGLSDVKAIHLPNRMAYPARYVIERESCPANCTACADVCPYGAIELKAEPRELELEAGAIIIATGWRPYDPAKLENLNFSTITDVITNVMMERLAAPDGPTGGHIRRLSDGTPVNSIAFVQCAGSRDEQHLPYCSSVCCLATLKQARYVRAANPDARVYIFYIDLRTPGKFQAFYESTRKDPHIQFIKGKVAKVSRGKEGKVLVEAEDILAGQKIRVEVDMAVLATGMEPNLKLEGLPAGIGPLDNEGFLTGQSGREGIIGVGAASAPLDVSSTIQEATGAALHAIQALKAN